MSQRYFARLRIVAATNEGYLRDGMVRRTERALGDKAHSAGQFAGHAVNLGGLQTLSQRQRRKDGGQPFGEHRLTTTRRSYHNKVMTSGRRHLQGPLDTLLPFHIAKVIFEMVLLCKKLPAGVDDFRFIVRGAIQKLNDILQRLHAVDFQLVDHRRLADVLLRYDEPLELLLARPDGDGQCPPDGLQAAVQSQLTHQHILS